MKPCSIQRNKAGEIEFIIAPNGNRSQLFDNLTSLVEDKNTALKKYSLTFTKSFKNWFGKSLYKDENGEPLVVMNQEGEPMYRAADKSEKHATENYGSYRTANVDKLIQSVYKEFNLLDSRGMYKSISHDIDYLAHTIERKYPGLNVTPQQSHDGWTILLTPRTSLPIDNAYYQIEEDTSQLSLTGKFNTKVEKTLIRFLNSLNIDVKINDKSLNKILNSKKWKTINPDKTARLFGAVDLLEKLIVVSENRQYQTLPKTAAYIIWELLGRKNIVRRQIFTSIQQWERFEELYELYAPKDIKERRLNPEWMNKDINDRYYLPSVKEQIIIDYLGELLQTYGEPTGLATNESADLNAEYFRRRKYPPMKSPEKVTKIEELYKGFLGKAFGIFQTLDPAQLKTALLDIVEDVYANETKKFLQREDRKVNPEDMTESTSTTRNFWTKEKSSGLFMENYEDIWKNNPDQHEIWKFLESLGIKLSGSIVLREYGDVYRSGKETLHDIDTVVPLDMLERDPLFPILLSTVKKGARDGYFKQAFNKRNTEFVVGSIIPILKQMSWFKTIDNKFAVGSTLNGKNIESFELAINETSGSFQAFVGREHQKGESITLTYELKLEDSDPITLDFFVRTQEGKYPERFEESWKDVKQVFEAKIGMGRSKDLIDLIMFKPRKGMGKRYSFQNAGYRMFTSDIPIVKDRAPNINDKPKTALEEELETSFTHLDKRMVAFFTKFGIKLEGVDKFKNTGTIARAKIAQNVIQVLKGKKKFDTLTEEASHFLIEMLEATEDSNMNSIYNTMNSEIETYSIYTDIVAENSKYREFYTNQGYTGDALEQILRKEAMGKVLTQYVLNKHAGRSRGYDSDAKIDRVKTLWQRIVDFWKSMFRTSYQRNSYIRASEIMFNSAIEDSNKLSLEKKEGRLKLADINLAQVEEEQETSNDQSSILGKLKNTNTSFELGRVNAEQEGIKAAWIEVGEQGELERYIGKPGTPYAGVVIKGRVSDEVKKFFWKKRISTKFETTEQKERREKYSEIRKTSGTEGHLAIQDIIESILGNKGPSHRKELQINSPFNAEQFNIVYKNVKSLLSEIRATQKKLDPEGKVKIIAEQLVHNPTEGYAGTVDVLAVYSNGQADIFDWKFVSPSREKGIVVKENGKFVIKEDPFLVKMDTYNIQLSAYKKTLMDHYGISQVRKSRIIPIHVRFKYDTVTEEMSNEISVLQMGSDMSEYLEQIPVANEMTDFDSLNDILESQIYKRETLKRRFEQAKGAARERLKTRLDSVTKSIRQIQVKKDIGYVLNEAKKSINKAQKRLGVDLKYLDDGLLNPEYMTNRELLDYYEDLKFYQTLLQVPDFLQEIKQDDAALYKDIVKIQEHVGRIINNEIKVGEQKLLQRGTEYAEGKGIKGLTTFNAELGFSTSYFVSLSKQSNPFLRTLWETVDGIQILKNESLKALANEIDTIQHNLLTKFSGEGVAVYDRLLNPETGNLWAKYSTEFWSAHNKAIEKNNAKWFKENYEVNEEYYNKTYQEWKTAAFKRIDNNFESSEAIKREKKSWEKQYDVKKHFSTASVNRGGQFFLRLKESKESEFMSKEYAEIAATPELKDFYDYHVQKVREFSDMFGMKLSHGFTSNVQQGMVDTLIQKGFNPKGLSDAFFDLLQVKEYNPIFGMIDPNTNQPIREIPRLFTSKITDKQGNIDSSLKTKDLGKSLYLLGMSAMEYKFNTEVADDILLLETLLTDDLVKETQRSETGTLLRGIDDKLLKSTKSTNSDTFSDFVDMYIFGRSLKTKDRVRKIFGQNISMNKTLLGLKQFHSMQVLGLKTPVALGAFGAGLINLKQQANKGLFITKENYNEALKLVMSGNSKVRALVEHFDLYQDDKFALRANRLSADYKSKYMTNDNFFVFLMGADRGLDAIVGVAMAMNHGLDEEGRVKRLKDLPEGTKSLWESLEYTEDEQWRPQAARDRYISKISNLDKKAFSQFRNKSREVSSKVKGTMTGEDKMRVNSTLIGRLMLHYKSWLPGIAMERFGNTRYNYILDHFDEGTHKTFWNNFGADVTTKQALDAEVGMHEHLGTVMQDLGKVAIDIVTFGYGPQFKIKEEKARLEFDKFLLEQEGNPEFEYETENEKEEVFNKFLELKRANIRAAITEIRAVVLLMLLLMMLGRDWDDDGKVDIRQTWVGRKLYAVLNRIYRETAVIVDPREFMQSRSTGIPLLGMAENGFKLVANSLDQFTDDVFGQDSKNDRSGRGYYTFKFFPGVGAVVKTLEIYDQDKSAKY